MGFTHHGKVHVWLVLIGVMMGLLAGCGSSPSGGPPDDDSEECPTVAACTPIQPSLIRINDGDPLAYVPSEGTVEENAADTVITIPQTFQNVSDQTVRRTVILVLPVDYGDHTHSLNEISGVIVEERLDALGDVVETLYLSDETSGEVSIDQSTLSATLQVLGTINATFEETSTGETRELIDGAFLASILLLPI